MLKRRKVVIYGAIAVVVALAFSFGGYAYFLKSDDWLIAKRQISTAQAVTDVVGKVKHISPSPLGFSYRGSGDWSEASVRMRIVGDKAEGQFKVEFEITDGRFALKKVKQLP